MKATAPAQPELVDLDAGTVDTVPPADLAPADPDPIPDTPKRGPGRPRKTAAEVAAPTVGRPSNTDKLAKSLTDQYVALGTILSIFAPTAGRTMIEQSDACAQSLASWASTNDKVRKALERVNTGAGAVSVLIAHAPIAVAIYADVTRPTALDAGDASALDFASSLFAGMPAPAFR